MHWIKQGKVILLLLLLLGVLAPTSCSDNKAGVNESAPAALRSELSATPVTTGLSEQKTFEYHIQSNGKLMPLKEQKFVAGSSGVLSVCNVSNNRPAQNGSLLVQFDLKALRLELERAHLNYFNGQLEYESQMMGYSRTNRASVSDTVKMKVEISSGLAAAKLDLQKAEHDLANATIKAPFSGRLVNVKVRPGMHVKAGDELFTIYSDKELVVETKVLETDISLIKLNQPADIIPVSNAANVYQAVVSEINPMVDESGLVTIKLKLVDTSGLLPGMNVSSIIKVPKHETLVVPKDAVVLRSGKPVVFTLENDLAKWNYVVTGLDNGLEVEIKEGLKSGQKVITSNNLQLAHDAPVVESHN